MVLTSLLLTVSLIRSGELDGQAAMELALNILRSNGIEQELAIHSLSQGDGKGWHYPFDKFWAVSFRGASATWNVWLSPVGDVLRIDSSTTLAPHLEEDTSPEALSKAAEAAEKMVRRLGYREALMPYHVVYWKSGHFRARLTPAIDGKPVINLNPSYGVSISGHAKSGRLQEFRIGPETPRVVHFQPKVAKDQAYRLLKDEQHKAEPETVRRIEVGLGYYHYRGESHARLVWWSRTLRELPDGEILKGSYNSTFVDALTGVLLKSESDRGGI